MKPFILKGAVKIASDPEIGAQYAYDSESQLWVDASTGIPAVVCSNPCSASRFGETPLTETREGADQSEVASFDASRFGETTQTRTMEGTDQTESATIQASRFGETSITKTFEGVDQGESSVGLTDETDLAEDCDGSASDGRPGGEHSRFDAPYSHF